MIGLSGAHVRALSQQHVTFGQTATADPGTKFERFKTLIGRVQDMGLTDQPLGIIKSNVKILGEGRGFVITQNFDGKPAEITLIPETSGFCVKSRDLRIDFDPKPTHGDRTEGVDYLDYRPELPDDGGFIFQMGDHFHDMWVSEVAAYGSAFQAKATLDAAYNNIGRQLVQAGVLPAEWFVPIKSI